MVGMIDFSQVDPNGANALARGFMASQDRQNQMQQQARANKLADLQYNSANRAEQNALAEEQVYKNNQNPAQIATQLRAAGLGKQAAAAEKALMEQRAAQVTRAKGIYDLTKTATGAIVANPTLATATAALQGLAQTAGVDVSQYAQELAQIGENPEAIRAWAAGHSMDADKLLPKFEQFNQGNKISTGTRDALTGKLTMSKETLPVSHLLTPEEEAQKRRVAQAGASNISLSTEKKYGDVVAGEFGKNDVETYKAAQQIPQDMRKIDETLSVLKNSNINTGIGADVFTVLDKAKAQFLADKKAGKKATDTEYLNSLLGSAVFPQIQALGIGARGMDTPAEREFLRNVMTGTIALNKDTLIKMTELRKRGLEDAAKQYNKRVDSGEFDALFAASKRDKKTAKIAVTPSGSGNPHAGKTDAEIKAALGL